VALLQTNSVMFEQEQDKNVITGSPVHVTVTLPLGESVKFPTIKTCIRYLDKLLLII
jgi:hypothetical protein